MPVDRDTSRLSAITPERWKRICAVLDRVLDADPARQQDVFEAACGAEGLAVEDALRFLAATNSDAEFLKQLPPAIVTAALRPLSEHVLLPAGSRFGCYEVVAPIGAGGMGDVYRARDTKLHREVALKVLPDHFAIDPDRLARFKREAQLLASLNHPNIAGIYGFEEAEVSSQSGQIVSALALELVEGPTLADRLSSGALSIQESLMVAQQLVDALEAAHDAGIVHRDLKPSNIKLRPSIGTDEVLVKVLDFGVAKALNPAEVGPSAARDVTPTITTPAATAAGVIMGTAAYMAPEQVKGRFVDQRADVWAFGCVLYEMLTGTRAFDGDSAADIFGRIVSSEPDWTKLPASTPESIRRLLSRCLEKDRKRRLAHIADARFDLEEEHAPQAAAPQRGWLRAASLIVAALVVGVIAGRLFWLRPSPSDSGAVMRFTIPLPRPLDFGPGDPPSLSSDGSQVAFMLRNPRQIYLRRLDQSEARPVAGTEDAAGPVVFSPNGAWLAYVTSVQLEAAGGVSHLMKIPVTGGKAVTVVDSVAPSATVVYDWDQDDYIYYIESNRVLRISATGGTPQVLFTSDGAKGERGVVRPKRLPGTSWVLFTLGIEKEIPGQARAPDLANATVHIMAAAVNLTTRERRTLFETGAAVHYGQAGSAGYLMYGRGEALMAVPFDVDRLSVTGEPRRVLEVPGIASGITADSAFDISASGTLAYKAFSIVDARADTMTWVDRRGAEEAIPVPPRHHTGPRISPDGKRVAITILRPGQRLPPLLGDIWTYDLPAGRPTRITFDGRTIDGSAIWSLNGGSFIYNTLTADRFAEMRTVPSDGSGLSIRHVIAGSSLATAGRFFPPTSIAPDGTHVTGMLGSGRPIVWVASLPLPDPAAYAQPTLKLILDSRMVEGDPQFSPDGRWIAYQSNRSGRLEIWVAPYPDPAGRWQQVSFDGGTTPRWSRDGRELFFRSGRKMMVVAVDSGPPFHADAPKVLFEGSFSRDYDVAPDGRRFLMIKPGSGDASPPNAEPAGELQVVVNWFDELRRRVPADK